MKWKWPKRKPSESIINIGRLAPIEVNHNVIHAPYPRPGVITITFFDMEGRQWVMPPIQCRGGAMYMENVPHRYEGQEWVRYEVKLYYE
jgi:hypothetical protein